MAISPMLKVTVLGYRPVLDEVISALQRCGVLEIASAELGESLDAVEPEEELLRLLDIRTSEAHFLRDFLGRYHVATHAMKAFVTEKFHVTADEFHGLEFDARFRRVHLKALGIFEQRVRLEREKAETENVLHDLAPWNEFRFQMGRWRGTDNTILFTGTVPAIEGNAIRNALREQVTEVTVEELGPLGDRQAWVVISHSSAVEEVRNILAATPFAETVFPGLSDYPAEESAILRDRLSAIAEKLAGLEEEAQKLSDDYFAQSVALVDVTESERDRLLVRRDFGSTQRSFMITGWVAKKKAGELETALAPFTDVDVSLDEPVSGDTPPVELDNPPLLKPFEILTDLYGRPEYGMADPTPLLAPFFWLFFAICIGDVGYGAMLIAGAWLVKHKLDVAPGVKRFTDLMMLGGVGAIIIGVLLGSYFALPAEVLPAFLVGLRLLDPIAEIQTFLLLALGIGVIQVFFGVIVAAVHAIKRGDTASAIADHLSVIFMFGLVAAAFGAGATGNGQWVRAALIIGILGAMILQGRALPAAIRPEGATALDRGLGLLWAAGLVIGMLGYAFTGSMPVLWALIGINLLAVVSKAARAGVLGVLLGAYQVYGLTGVVGDVLSYLRLAALGLSSALVGWVFNILTELVWSAASPLFDRGGFSLVGGALIGLGAVAVFTVGHVFNVVINLLGAFVHPARLQFVEFFSKFYEAGGRNYVPFAVRTENLVLGASGAEREGGGS